MNQTPPQITIEPRGKTLLSRLSLVWLIPFAALAAALVLAWQSYSNLGPQISIEFENGAGIAKDETVLKFRDISVGVVEDVRFSDNLATVIATVRLDKEVAPFVDRGASFWVVRPEVSLQGVSGLDTVLSGVFIEGAWDDEIGEPETVFRGLEEAPLFRPSRPGLEIAIRATANGQLTENAPIFFRGIEVGRVGKARISPITNFAVAEAIIFEPHDRLITPNTRFWDTSGFSVLIGTSGAEIDFTSLSTLISGGVSFETFVSGGERSADGDLFLIYGDEETARNSVFNASEVETLDVSVVFDDNISGLSIGAPVELSGIQIGQVQSVNGIIDRATYGDGRVRLNAVLSIQPARLGLETTPSPGAALNFLAGRVREGFRARLASASLLTGGLKVEIIEVPDAPLATITDLNARIPELPATQSEISDAGASVEGAINRFNNLPIEDLLTAAIDFMTSAERLVSSQALQDTPAEIAGLLSDMRGLVTSDDIKTIPVTINTLLTRIDVIISDLEQQQLIARLGETVDAAKAAATGIGAAIDGLPALLASVEAVAKKAESLPAEALMSELTQTASAARTLLAGEQAQALPRALTSALEDIQTTLAELRRWGGLVDTTTAVVAQVGTVVSQVEENALISTLQASIDQIRLTAASVEGAIAGMPELITAVSAFAQEAQALPLEQLVQDASKTIEAVRRILDDPATQRLAPGLSNALLEVETLLVEIRSDGGLLNAANSAVGSANDLFRQIEQDALVAQLISAVNSAASAAQGIEDAAGGLPELITAFSDVARKAEALPVETLLAELDRLAKTAREVIGTTEFRALPADMSAALLEIQSTVKTLREGGIVANANATLASARSAADSVARAADDLPGLMNRAATVLSQANRTIQSFERGEQITREVEDALRDIQKAARALASLARSIERNPSALVRGR